MQDPPYTCRCHTSYQGNSAYICKVIKEILRTFVRGIRCTASSMSSSQSRGFPSFAFSRVKNPDSFKILCTFPCGLHEDLIEMSSRTPTWNFHFVKQRSVYEILNQKHKILLIVFVMSLSVSRNAGNSYNNTSNCNSWRNCHIDWVKEWINLNSFSYMDVSWKRKFLRSLKKGVYSFMCVT